MAIKNPMAFFRAARARSARRKYKMKADMWDETDPRPSPMRIKAAYGRARTRNALSRFVPQRRFVAFIDADYIILARSHPSIDVNAARLPLSRPLFRSLFNGVRDQKWRAYWKYIATLMTRRRINWSASEDIFASTQIHLPIFIVVIVISLLLLL